MKIFILALSLLAVSPVFARHKSMQTRTGNTETLIFYSGSERHEVPLSKYSWNNSGCIIYTDKAGAENIVCGSFWLIEKK